MPLIHMPLQESPMLLQKIRNRLAYLRNKRNIRKFDRAVDETSWRGADFYPATFSPFPLPEAEGPFVFGSWRNLHISDAVGTFAADLASRFRARITGFLGADARLDDIYLFYYDPAKRQENWSYSNSWHDDNVGHRIKIFACFEGNGSTPTVVLPHSYNKPYKRRREERNRFRGIRDTRAQDGEVRLPYKAGDVAIFDTSCLHRGRYEGAAGKRTVLVMEFIDRHKCNAIAGFLPCGPGMGRTGEILLDPGACQALEKSGFLDPALLAQKAGGYSYSIANMEGAAPSPA